MKACDTLGCENRCRDSADYCGACLAEQKLHAEDEETLLVAYTAAGLDQLEEYLRPRARFCDWLNDHGRP